MMGWTAHDAVIAVTGDDSADRVGLTERVEQWRGELPPEWQPLIVGPVVSIVNGYLTWAFLPDGSKSGWREDLDGDRYRAEFAALFDGAYASVLEVKFGGDMRGEGVPLTARYVGAGEGDGG